MYIYICIKQRMNIYTYSYSLESRERERGEKISPNKYPLYMYRVTCLQTHIYSVQYSGSNSTAHQFFFYNDSSTLPQMISNDSRFPYFRDVHEGTTKASCDILAKLLVKELYELIEIQVAITINIHELKKNLHVRGGVAPFC